MVGRVARTSGIRPGIQANAGGPVTLVRAQHGRWCSDSCWLPAVAVPAGDQLDPPYPCRADLIWAAQKRNPAEGNPRSMPHPGGRLQIRARTWAPGARSVRNRRGRRRFPTSARAFPKAVTVLSGDRDSVIDLSARRDRTRTGRPRRRSASRADETAGSRSASRSRTAGPVPPTTTPPLSLQSGRNRRSPFRRALPHRRPPIRRRPRRRHPHHPTRRQRRHPRSSSPSAEGRSDRRSPPAGRQ